MYLLILDVNYRWIKYINEWKNILKLTYLKYASSNTNFIEVKIFLFYSIIFKFSSLN